MSETRRILLMHISTWFQIAGCATTVSTSFREAYFKHIAVGGLGMTPLEAGWTDISLVSCAETSGRILASYSFTYNKNTHLCTPGGWVSAQDPVPSSEQGELYTRLVCHSPTNFRLIPSQGLAACLMMSQDRLNYTDAMKTCAEQGGHLVTFKTQEKFYGLWDLLRRYVNTEEFWVGLNDMEDEGVFKWVDDGSVLDDKLKSVIFNRQQPDNNMGLEDCASSSYDYPPLNDARCNGSRRFFCERTISSKMN